MEALGAVIVIFGLVYAVVLIVLPFVVVSMNGKIRETNNLLTAILQELRKQP